MTDDAVSRQRVLQTMLEASTTQPSKIGPRSGGRADLRGGARRHRTSRGRGHAALEAGRRSSSCSGSCGIDLPATSARSGSRTTTPLVETVMHERRTAAVEDLSQTPEVKPPRSERGREVSQRARGAHSRRREPPSARSCCFPPTCGSGRRPNFRSPNGWPPRRAWCCCRRGCSRRSTAAARRPRTLRSGRRGSWPRCRTTSARPPTRSA